MANMEFLCYLCYIMSWFAVVPAIYRIFKRKSSVDYSIPTMVFNASYNVIWLVYVIYNPTFELVVCSIIDLILALLYLVSVLLYYNKKK